MPRLNNNQRPRKWTDEGKAALRQALKDGATLQQLADEHGVSKQRMAQITGAVRRMKAWNKTYSIYPAIDSWMKYNRVTYAMLTDMIGYATSASAQVAVQRRLMGEREMYKGFIDSLLRVTGLTYEEAFRKENRNGS